jgi:hypothetical protein
LEQTVLTPNGVLIIWQHSLNGNATAVYLDLVDRCGKSMATQLAADELEMELTEFRIDTTWTSTNLAFLLAWTTKSLDLDAVLVLTATPAQKRVWFARAIAPKSVLSLAILQFDTSECLTSIGVGSSHVKADFSVFYEHVKDVATRTDQATCIAQQGTSWRANETKIAATSGADKSTFLGANGQHHSFAIPRKKWKAMSPAERTAALAKSRPDKGLPPKATWHCDPAEHCHLNSATTLAVTLPLQ